MVRTNPNDDWPDHRSERYGAGGSEWEGLRNELVALLDQVEDQVLSGRGAAAAAPRVQPQRAANPARHHEALRSVRQAVDRLTDRVEAEPMPRRDAIAEAVNQIRARQAGQPVQTSAPRMSQASERGNPAEVAGVAHSVAALGQRIEAFEAKFVSRLDTLDRHGDIAAQVAQLSEVIELLAGAVGESGQVKRLEAQISQLAEAVTAGNGTSTAKQLEELTATIEKLTAHQVQTAGRDEQVTAEANAQQAATMQLIEEIVLNIYSRLDALEQARPTAMPELEKISSDMAALSAAVGQAQDFPALLERIDALGERIGGLESRKDDGTEALRESISVLRNVVIEALEPRFTAIEVSLSELGTKADAATQTVDISGVEGQLRHLAKRLDETSGDIIALAKQREAETVGGDAPDLPALADLIVERTRAQTTPAEPQPDALAKADLAALEERLAKLFTSEKAPAQPVIVLDGVKDSIAQVDNRLARLEAMLNEQPAKPRQSAITESAPVDATPVLAEPALAEAVPAETVAPAPKPAPAARRGKRPDAMPKDPVSGTTARVLENPILDDPAPEAEEPPTRPFQIDPEAVDRPAKPQSSFSGGDDGHFESRWAGPSADAPVAGTNVSRSSFIEAARRSARQQALSAGEAEPRSLIGRAMSRFQKSEQAAPVEPQTPTNSAAPGREKLKGAARVSNSRVEPARAADPIVDPFADISDEETKKPSFIARNKRLLLVGVALVVIVAAGATLLLGRGNPARTAPAPAAAVTETAPATNDAEAERAGSLTSTVRMVDQQPSLSAGAPDAAMLLDGMPVDPLQTAALAPQPDRYIDRNGTTSLSATLPVIAVPEGIGPELLRAAAEGGDRYAQFEVGAILTEGHVVEQDFAQAAAWYERSAVQGFTPAQYRLGNLYESGRGVARDLDQARLWYQRAAESGNRMSMHNLASLYAGGELDNQDFAAAAHWFEEAAARGLTDSQFNLGMLYARGLGVEQDFEKSYIWFSLAGRSGDEDAVASRDDIARSLDAETVQRLNDTVTAWRPVEIDLAANFAPIGTWDDTFDPGQTISNNDVVLRVQMLLAKLGFDVGQPDGIVGPRTRDAITAFERATGMNEVGQINPRLLAVLGSQPV